MPNWTSNTIRVTGDPARIRAFRDAVASEYQSFDFNRLIPMPELLKRAGYGARTIDGQKATSWFVITHGEYGIPERVRHFTPEEKATLREIGYSTWYNWACAQWGTKWNAACVSITAATFIDPDEIEVTFDTASNAPLPIFRKMIELFPDLRFEFRWVDKDQPGIEHALNSATFNAGGGQ